MLCKPLFIIHGRVKAFKAYTGVQNEVPQLKNGHRTCITRLYKREVSRLNANK